MADLNVGTLTDSRSLSATTNTDRISSASTDLQTNQPFLSGSSGTGIGLKAEYYSGRNFEQLKLTRTDATVNFDWKTASPDSTLGADDFSVLWTGQVQAQYSETYTFYTNSDDGVKLWVDGKALINNWTEHPVTENQGTITLVAGQKYDIKLEYAEHKGEAVSKLLWSSASQAKAIVAQTQLYAGSDSGSLELPLLVVDEPKLAANKDTIRINVDWNAIEGKSTELNFGLNAFQGFRAENFDNTAYRSNMSYMNPGLIRFHNSGALQDSSTPDGMINTAQKTWDADKIKRALAASVATFGADQPERMINIPTWPDWMDANKDGFLDTHQFDSFAQLSASLVKIVNQDNRFGVKYWEITNEKDDHYFTKFHSNGGWGDLKDAKQPDHLDELITIYNKVAVAMKQVDSTIQVGGPGAARADLQPFYVPFIQGTVKNLDFFTYHHYATGSASASDSEIYGVPKYTGSHTATMVKALKAASPDRYIPVILGEYNISWTWETRDPRMTSHKGVVYDALTMVEAVKSGAFATLAWNEKDGTYGKMSDSGELRLGGRFLQLANKFLVGDRVSTISNREGAVTTFAVNNTATGHKTYLIINHSSSPQEVLTDFKKWVPAQKNVDSYEISAAGYAQKTVRWSDINNGITLPEDSVTLLDFTT